MPAASEKFLQFLRQPPFALRPAAADIDGIIAVPVVERFYPAGSSIIEEGRTRRSLTLISSGWTIASKTIGNGTRLVTDFPLCGDLVSGGSIAGRAYRSVIAATDVTSFELRLDGAWFGSRYSPFLAKAMMMSMARNYGIIMEHLGCVARRRPTERTVCLFLELAYRLDQAGVCSGDRFAFPFTQGDLADALGLTAIHMNRVLRVLRENGLLTVRGGTVVLTARHAMHSMTRFDPSYLAFDDAGD